MTREKSLVKNCAASLMLALVFSSCLGLDLSPQAERQSRQFIEDRGKVQNPLLPSFRSNIESNEEGACLTVEAMEAGSHLSPGTTSTAGEFGFLRTITINQKKEIKVAMNVAGFPLLLLSVAEKTPLTAEDFEKSVRQKCKNGELGGLSCFVAKNILPHFFGLWRGQVNTALDEAFPGIFYDEADPKNSLLYLLVRKALAERAGNNPSGKDLVIDAQTPLEALKNLHLFVESEEWSDWANDVARSQSSAILAFRDHQAMDLSGRSVRLCGLNLLHRGFAQLLSLKGYRRPELKSNAAGEMYLKKLDKKGWTFRDRLGAFADRASGRRLNLTASEIAGYRPECRVLWPMDRPPVDDQTVEMSLANLSEYLHLIRGLSYSYEATHPGAPWVGTNNPYLLGDMTSPESSAILPHEAHSLSLGLLTMGFKNLAAFHIQKIKADKSAAGPDEGSQAKGIILHQDGKVELSEILTMAEFVTRLHQTLGYFKNRPADQWQALSPSYGESTLASLMGRALYSAASLRCIKEKYPTAPSCNEPAPAVKAELDCSAAAAEMSHGSSALPYEDDSLYSKLNALKLPLVMLMNQMAGKNSEACVATANWDLKSGQVLPLRRCQTDLIVQYRDTLKLMALQNQSQALLKQALQYR